MPHAVEVIRREHAALAAALRTLLSHTAERRRAGALPDFALLRALLFYVDEFPEKHHHRLETEVLFPKLRARTPRHRDVLDRLDWEHGRGEARVRDLQHSLLAFEMLGEARGAAFEDAAAQYVEFYLAHMAAEEQHILPLAEQCLTDTDWGELDDAFRGHADPLAGGVPDAAHAALFDRIAAGIAAEATAQPAGA